MRDPVGHVTVNEHVPSQRFNRFVDEKLKDWMRENNFGDAVAEYEVAFFDEDPLGETSCLIVVHSGQNLWKAWESADNPRMALSRSLEHLTLESTEFESAEAAIATTASNRQPTTSISGSSIAPIVDDESNPGTQH